MDLQNKLIQNDRRAKNMKSFFSPLYYGHQVVRVGLNMPDEHKIIFVGKSPNMQMGVT